MDDMQCSDPAELDPIVHSLPIRFIRVPAGVKLATLQHHKPISSLRGLPKEIQTKLNGNLVQVVYPAERLPPDSKPEDVGKYENVMEGKMSMSENQATPNQARSAWLGNFTPDGLNLLPLTGGEAHLELTLRWLDLDLEAKKRALAKEAEADAPPAEIKGVLLSAARKEIGTTALQEVYNEKRNQNWRRLKVMGPETTETMQIMDVLRGDNIKLEPMDKGKGKAVEMEGLDEVDWKEEDADAMRD